MATFYDFASVQAKVADMLTFAPKFILNPAYMQALALPIQLQWQQMPFDRHKADTLVESPGIYAFSIQHAQAGLPPHSYVLYIGEVGAKQGPTRTLRARYKEYFREKVRPKRQHVAYFLNAWESCLVFHFVTLDPKAVNLLEIEMKLNDALIPPFSRGDFSPEVRPMKRLSESF